MLARFATGRGGEGEQAFAALVARHGPMVLGVCRAMLGNAHDAEDAFQATFVILARKAGSLRQPDLLGPWLHKVAHRAALQVKVENARRKRRETEAAMSGVRPAGDAGSQEPGPAAREDMEILHQEIDRLPEKYRSAIVLCDLQGLTHEEAARLLGRPVGTIGARLSRARDRLRGRLSRRGMASPAVALGAALRTSHELTVPTTLADSTIRAAMAVSAGLTAGAVPASIAILSRGVLRSMFLDEIEDDLVRDTRSRSRRDRRGVARTADDDSQTRAGGRRSSPGPRRRLRPPRSPPTRRRPRDGPDRAQRATSSGSPGESTPTSMPTPTTSRPRRSSAPTASRS